VVGFEEGMRGTYAAWQGAAVARWCDGDVVLVHVSAHVQAVSRMRDEIARSGVPVSYAVARGEVVDALAAVAQDRDADLIVVGAHGRAAVRRSVAERLVRETSASVLAMRGTPVTGGYEHIVVGTDFSVYSVPAVSRALAMAHETADVQVVHWWSVPEATRRDDRRTDADLRREQAEFSAERGAALLEAHRGERRLRFRAIEGHARDALPEHAAQECADLVAVGSHGYDGLRRALLGSVAEAVIRRAPCAVLVAR
jgi:nucleotide-binding universal stress UspA family protein